MAKLPPPNLPPAAMPWARDIEKRLGDAGTKASRAYTNVGAFGQVIADVNNRTVTQTLDIEAHETKLTENAEAVAQAEAEIAALNAPGGPLDTLDQEFAAHRQRFLAEQGYAYRIVDAEDLVPGA